VIPLRVLWRESHATSALVAGLLAAIPASLFAAIVIYLRDRLVSGPPAVELVPPGAYLAWCVGIGGLFGVTVAFTAHHVAPPAGAFWGVLYGVLVWLVGFVLVMPWIRPELAVHTRLGLLWHIAYGASVGAFFPLCRFGERKRHRVKR
jgi:hypothetical protein